MSGDQQVRLMASQFAAKSALYPKIEKLDDNVLASKSYKCSLSKHRCLTSHTITALPLDVEILTIVPSGASRWVQTVRIDTREKDGHRMMKGSYESEKNLYHYIPENVPKPISWGSYAADPDMYYYLCRFHNMIDELPLPKALVPIIPQLHTANMDKSPCGTYGFHVTTHLANLPNDNPWQTSWETYFQQAMRNMFEFEEKAHGKDLKLESLKEALHEKVIPQLLRPLETGERSIQPCLIHSHIWPGNIILDSDSDRVIIFDSCAYWGHNEADLGTWRASRYRLGQPYIEEYQKIMGISEP